MNKSSGPIQVDSISGLVDAVLGLRPKGGGPLWFRGHSKQSYELRPSLLRDGKSSDAVEERERRLVTRYRQRSPAMAAESRGPGTDWDLLFSMQHHGVPTRLLDWSENLFVAAYFALMGDYDDVPVVWCFDPLAWNRSCPHLSTYGDDIHVLNTSDEDLDPYRASTDGKLKRRVHSVVAMYGAYNSRRIVAQSGTFTIWGKITESMEEIASKRESTALQALVIRGERKSIFEELRLLGFRETMLFPELAILGKELSLMEGWRGQ